MPLKIHMHIYAYQHQYIVLCMYTCRRASLLKYMTSKTLFHRGTPKHKALKKRHTADATSQSLHVSVSIALALADVIVPIVLG